MKSVNEMTLLTFPGQGSQYPGMLTQRTNDPTASLVYEEAENILGVHLSEIDSEQALQHTRNIQLSLLICGVAWGNTLLKKEIIPDFVLGLSVGAYPAAVISQSISFEEAVKLICHRGELMQAAYPSGYGMVAINGTNRTTVERHLHTYHENNKEAYLANINSDTQFVLSGKVHDINKVADEINNESCSSSQLLDVPVPSHCNLLDDASNTLSQIADSTKFSAPQIKYVSAAKARVILNAEGVKDDLVRNMSRQVNWLDSCEMLHERGVNKIIQVPPGATLTNLCKRIIPDGECLSVSNKSFQLNVLGISSK
ncbi:MAG: ACP S-malonyltransferase [Neptuniibacter sp.]